MVMTVVPATETSSSKDSSGGGEAPFERSTRLVCGVFVGPAMLRAGIAVGAAPLVRSMNMALAEAAGAATLRSGAAGSGATDFPAVRSTNAVCGAGLCGASEDAARTALAAIAVITKAQASGARARRGRGMGGPLFVALGDSTGWRDQCIEFF